MYHAPLETTLNIVAVEDDVKHRFSKTISIVILPVMFVGDDVNYRTHAESPLPCIAQRLKDTTLDI